MGARYRVCQAQSYPDGGPCRANRAQTCRYMFVAFSDRIVGECAFGAA